MDPRPITAALDRAARGEPGAEEMLWELVNADLKRLAASRVRSLPAGQTLQATALVHEAWVRLGTGTAPDFANRTHFFSAAVRSMRNLLVDQARAKGRQERGGGLVAEELSTAALAGDGGPDLDLLALDEALDALAEEYERPARIVMQRFFAGLSIPEIAELLEVTTRTVDRDYLLARAWLRRRLDGA